MLINMLPRIRITPQRLARTLVPGSRSESQGFRFGHCRNSERFISTQSDAGTFTLLPTRGLLEIKGKDSSKFLQGLITNQMLKIENGGGGFLAAFLSPKGRVMYDVFIHPSNLTTEGADPSFLIECDARALPELHKHIARFVLRSKVKMTGVTEAFDVYSVLDDASAQSTTPLASDNAAVMERLGKMNASIGMLDNRAGNMLGYRAIVPKGRRLSLPESYLQGTLEDYHVRRILLGVPEGMDDFIAGMSLPLECNLDYMNGVDFRKGCYVGQELTIRTYHKGITRKRVMPVQYFRPEEPVPETMRFIKGDSHVVPSQSELFPVKTADTLNVATSTASARPVRASGKTGSNVGNIGLALVKLDQVSEGNIFEVMDREGATVRVKAFFPSWWPKQTADTE
ncbi:transferase CAF17, mitochondrial [Entomortierella parvispora]|uniref:Transferase CAF17, mitochondrial n=1 Tax=Entomortierella parvispora TaxID=205924 RepID=A0A9P3HKB0_9FUNG|nr:transferase CAF17, mitochondrial [Entomortierella parvispora]